MSGLISRIMNRIFKKERCEVKKKPLLLDENEERQFEHNFKEALIELGGNLHTEEDVEAIIMKAIQSAYDFYDADWVGILTADAGTQMWSATRWISRKTGANVETLFDDEEYFENYPQWVESIKSGRAIVIEDISVQPNISEIEMARYKKLEVQGVMGVPYGLRSLGFMIVKNPRRYKNNPDYLKMMAFVSLSSYYQQQLIEGMKLMREITTDKDISDPNSIRINLFGVPEIITSAGCLSEQIYKSVQGWKIITLLVLHGRPMPSRTIAASLWPDDDIEARMTTVRNVIFRFRDKTTFLETEPFILRGDYGYELNPKLGITSDVSEFEAIWNEAHATEDIDKQIFLIRKGMSLYKGRIYAEYADEPWLMIEATAYETQYIRMTNMLLKVFANRLDWNQVHETATESLKKVSGNTVAYYWRIIALSKIGAVDSAKAELEAVRPILSAEEYQEICLKLSDANKK